MKLGSDLEPGRVRPLSTALTTHETSDEPLAMVALPVIRRLVCFCRTWPDTSPLAPRRSGTPCVLRLAFYLGTVLSAVLRIPGLRGGEYTPGTGAISFCGGCSNRRYFGMRRNPPTSSRSWIFPYSVKKRQCFAQPQRAIFSKMGAAAAGFTYAILCITPLVARRGGGTETTKKHSAITECFGNP